MKYDKEHIEIIINELSEGNGRVNACKRAGINYQTFLNWLEDPDKIEFLDAVKKAEMTGGDKTKDAAILAIKAKFATQWQAAAWWLERNYPEQYRNRTEIAATKEHTEAILKAFELPDDEVPEPKS